MKHYRPKIGDTVRNREGEVGTVTKMENIHNVFVKYYDGGDGIHCLSRSKKCHRPHPLGHYDPLFPVQPSRGCPRTLQCPKSNVGYDPHDHRPFCIRCDKGIDKKIDSFFSSIPFKSKKIFINNPTKG
jgi:hypothetical protein